MTGPLACQSLLAPDPRGQPPQCGCRWAGRDTDARLEQPGAQQVEPVPGTTSPTPGRAGLAEAPCPRHPACTRLAPTAAHFPTSRQPSRAQGSRHWERVLFSGTPGCPGSWGASLPATQEPLEESTWHQAKENPKAHPTSLEASSSPEQTGHPDTLAPRSCPPRALGQSGSLWRQRPCGGPPVPALDSLEVGLLFWVAPSTPARAACNPGPFLPPNSWAPRSSIPAPPPAGRQPPLQASPLI